MSPAFPMPVPFDNSAFEVGGLTVESASDRVCIHGSTDLRRDREGQKNARILAEYFRALAASLDAEGAGLPVHAPDDKPTSRPNPFAKS